MSLLLCKKLLFGVVLVLTLSLCLCYSHAAEKQKHPHFHDHKDVKLITLRNKLTFQIPSSLATSQWRNIGQCNRSSLINIFWSDLKLNATLQALILESIEASQSHGRNSTSPWTISNLLDAFNDYLTFVPVSYDAFHYLWEIGDILDGEVWITDPTVQSFLKSFVVARGTFLYSPVTSPVVSEWISYAKINLQEYIVPSNGFSSFGEFFTREINMTFRPIAYPDLSEVFVSPIDGTFENKISITSVDMPFRVKGEMSINIYKLLGGHAASAEKYVGGEGMILMLSADNYHRWRSPTTGNITDLYMIGNHYYGVPGYLWYPQFSYVYHRCAITFSISVPFERRKSVRRSVSAVVVPIGISEVGSVIPYKYPGDYVRKGDPLGQFDLGGSAVFVAFEKGVKLDYGARKEDDKIKVGEFLASLSYG